MKKQFFGLIVYFIIAVSIFGQSIDKSKYNAIDPFDYKLEEEKAPKGSVRLYKSVVRFSAQNGTVFSFNSLDQSTLLALKINKHFDLPNPNQTVTIYYTATKGIIDALVLDEIDVSNTAETGIGLVKSPAAKPGSIERSAYTAIDPFDYKMDAETAEKGTVRKYKSTVLFSAQSGITYTFFGEGEATLLSLKTLKRFNPLKENQKVVIYYTANKGIIDSLTLDDIEY